MRNIEKKRARERVYRQNNRESFRKRKREHYFRNREKILKSQREYAVKNSAKIAARQKRYRAANREVSLARSRAWMKNNPERRKAYIREWNKNNIEKKRGYARKWATINGNVKRNRARKMADPKFHITKIIRSRTENAFSRIKLNKPCKTMELLGCDWQSVKLHIESKFTPGMTWANMGLFGWHIDHILPCASFDLTDQEQQRKCFHYTNLQPLWAADNLAKGAKILPEYQKTA